MRMAMQDQKFIDIEECNPFRRATLDRVTICGKLRLLARSVWPGVKQDLSRPVQCRQNFGRGVLAPIVVDDDPIDTEKLVPGNPFQKIRSLVPGEAA